MFNFNLKFPVIIGKAEYVYLESKRDNLGKTDSQAGIQIVSNDMTRCFSETKKQG